MHWSFEGGKPELVRSKDVPWLLLRLGVPKMVSTNGSEEIQKKKTYSMVISEQLVQKVDCLATDKFLVVCVDKRIPRFPGVATKDIVILRIQLDVVLVEIFKKFVSAENFRNLNELVEIATSVEEGFFAEYH